MKGITFPEFYDKLYYGADIDFCYENMYYHICAGYEDKNIHSITVYKYDKHPDTTPSYYEEIYSRSDSDIKTNIENFLSSSIIDGESLQQINFDIDILYI